MEGQGKGDKKGKGAGKGGKGGAKRDASTGRFQPRQGKFMV